MITKINFGENWGAVAATHVHQPITPTSNSRDIALIIELKKEELTEQLRITLFYRIKRRRRREREGEKKKKTNIRKVNSNVTVIISWRKRLNAATAAEIYREWCTWWFWFLPQRWVWYSLFIYKCFAPQNNRIYWSSMFHRIKTSFEINLFTMNIWK